MPQRSARKYICRLAAPKPRAMDIAKQELRCSTFSLSGSRSTSTSAASSSAPRSIRLSRLNDQRVATKRHKKHKRKKQRNCQGNQATRFFCLCAFCAFLWLTLSCGEVCGAGGQEILWGDGLGEEGVYLF